MFNPFQEVEYAKVLMKNHIAKCKEPVDYSQYECGMQDHLMEKASDHMDFCVRAYAFLCGEQIDNQFTVYDVQELIELVTNLDYMVEANYQHMVDMQGVA